MRNSSSLDWLRFMHTPNDYRVSPIKKMSSTITKFFASFLAYGVANKKKRFSAIGRFSEGLAPVKGKNPMGIH